MDIQAIIFDFSKAPAGNEREVLCTLRKRGYKLASSFDSGACDVIFERKEHASRETLLAVAKTLGVAPGECAVAESESDRLFAAKDSGMTAIGIGEAAACIYADICLGSFAELADIFA